MFLLRLLSRPLRVLLTAVHPAFSCCASCGEIKIPVQGRLCASLTPDFPVDCVILAVSSAWEGADLTASAKAVRNALPFIRRLYIVREPAAAPSGAPAELPADTEILSPASLPRQAETGMNRGEALPVEALLHVIPEVSEHFLVLHAPLSPEPAQEPLHPLDFFTPNGIPLVSLCAVAVPSPRLESFLQALRREGLPADARLAFTAGLDARTRESAAEFLPLYVGAIARQAGDGESGGPDYSAAFAHWTYAAARAVPRGELLAAKVAALLDRSRSTPARRNGSA